MLPLAIAGVQAGLGLAQGIYGMVQQNKARKSLEQLVKERPYQGVSSAMEKFSKEPISALYRQEQERLGQRGLGTAIGAVGKGDARSMGMTNRFLQTTQDATTSRYGAYNQAMADAQQQYGMAQERAMGRKQDVWNTMAAGAQQARAEGSENMWQGIGGMARAGAYAWENIPQSTQQGITPQGSQLANLSQARGLYGGQNVQGGFNFPQYPQNPVNTNVNGWSFMDYTNK